MSEKNIIKKSKIPSTIKTLYSDLLKLGVNSGDTVLVHSSLSSIGWVCGGAHAVICALMESIGMEGTLVMPTHSGHLSDPAQWENPPVPKEWVQTIYDNMPPYDSMITPTSGMGCIPELFRRFPNTIRSNHPQVSFAANGKLANDIVNDHDLTPGFGMDSPLGKLYKLDAKVLLLGAGYDSCTSFHLAESLIHNMPVKKIGTPILDNGVRVWKWFNDFEYNSDDFELIGKAYEDNNIVNKGDVGNAQCRLFKIKGAVDFAKQWLTENRLC